MNRIILLGASNLTLSFPRLFESLRKTIDGRLDVLAAHGHGRSYGMPSRVLFRELPGIQDCRLWQDLDASTDRCDRTLALVTDIGNDILYGATADQISEWINTCILRLIERRAQIVVTLLPLASVERLSQWRFNLTKAVFFPRQPISFGHAIQCARDLNAQLEQLAQRPEVQTVTPQQDWYGFDPIHIRRGRRAEAWQTILASWFPGGQPLITVKPTMARTLQLWTARPATRRLFRFAQTAEQPIRHLADQTTLGLY